LVAIISLMLLSACDADETSSAAAVSPEEAITEAVQDYLDEQGGLFAQAEIKVEQLEDEFARVQIISTDPDRPGGFTGFLQRIDGNWAVLLAGVRFSTTEAQALGIPESILPEGWVLTDEELPAEPPPSLPADCVEPDDETLSWVDDAWGYCLLYPATHTVVQLESGNTEIVVGEVMNHIDPRISITREDLAGRALVQVVDDFLSGYEGFEIARSDVTLEGQEAVLLDGIPGQDYYRSLFVAHNGVLYKVSVAPYDPNLDSLAQSERLYALALESFRFTTP
jgi:hypothetical protein